MHINEYTTLQISNILQRVRCEVNISRFRPQFLSSLSEFYHALSRFFSFDLFRDFFMEICQTFCFWVYPGVSSKVSSIQRFPQICSQSFFRDCFGIPLRFSAKVFTGSLQELLPGFHSERLPVCSQSFLWDCLHRSCKSLSKVPIGFSICCFPE